MMKKVKLGFCPIGKFVFSHEDALVYKKKLEVRMQEWGVDFIGIDAVIKDGIVRSYEDAQVAVDFLHSQKIDCVFLPHCNFGTESATGLIGKKLGVPVLLWGPRDEAPLADGTRLRDSLCGMFAASKVLVKLGVPFTYIENCRVDDEAFSQGMDKFLRVSNVVKRLKGARIGMVGNRIDFFWSTIIDESDLLQKYGIEVLPMDLAKTIRLTKEKAGRDRKAYLDEISAISKELDISATTEQGMIHALALRDVLYHFATANHLSAIAVESFMSLNEELGVCTSFAQSQVSDLGIPCICESDIHGAVSAILAEAAGFNAAPSFFADLTIRHPENDNGLLLWHDSSPLSLKAPDCKGALGTHWIIPDFETGMSHWRLKDGELTILRFDGERGKYKLLAEKCRTIPGPFTQNTYVWVELDNWKRFERKIIEGPYIHHTACIYGDYTEVFEEACKYIDGLEFDPVK